MSILPLHFKTPLKERPASALLVAVLLMSLLTALSLGVSLIVIGDLGAMRSMVSGVQSSYAAEGMNEIGLKIVEEHLPGFEADLSGYRLANQVDGVLSIEARGTQVPCHAEWRRLALHESVQLPLFAELLNGDLEKITNFYVEFYLGDEQGGASNVSQRTDILRWRINGFRELSGNLVPEAISEFIPLREVNVLTTRFGTVLDKAYDARYSSAKYVDSQNKIFYEAYPIADFLKNHTLNYLTLTNNGVNFPDQYIYFRLVSADSIPAVCEFIELTGEGAESTESVKKQLQTTVREGENLPVFDFVIYHTSGELSQ